MIQPATQPVTETPSRLRRYAAALAVSLAIWCTSPFLGLVRDALFDRFSERAVRILAVSLGILLMLVLAVAVWKMWQKLRRGDLHAWQWLGLAVVLGLLWFQVHGFKIGIPSSDIAEKIHIVEYGALAILLYRAARRAPRFSAEAGHRVGDLGVVIVPLFGAALAGVVDESVQGFFQLRTGDIRDVALNALAGLTGLALAMTVSPPKSWRRLAPPRTRLGVLVASTILAAGLFFYEAHLGYEIHDQEIGRFVSWFEPDELLRLQEDRAQRWATDPPALKAWDPEDYYLTEAGWHAQHRNASLESGDLWLAVQANRILETYYAPFLDLESYRGSGRHRWYPNHRNGLYAEHPAMPDIYVSPVLQSRLETRVSHGLWLALSFVAAGLGFWLTRGLPTTERTSRA